LQDEKGNKRGLTKTGWATGHVQGKEKWWVNEKGQDGKSKKKNRNEGGPQYNQNTFGIGKTGRKSY